MNRFIPFIVALLALGAPLTASAQYDSYRGAGTVRCESEDNRTRTCRVDTRGGDLRASGTNPGAGIWTRSGSIFETPCPTLRMAAITERQR